MYTHYSGGGMMGYCILTTKVTINNQNQISHNLDLDSGIYALQMFNLLFLN